MIIVRSIFGRTLLERKMNKKIMVGIVIGIATGLTIGSLNYFFGNSESNKWVLPAVSGFVAGFVSVMYLSVAHQRKKSS
jgi:high-affinity Fe2+/Pb2+ permease